MARVRGQIDLSQINDMNTFMRFASALFNNILDIVNGKIDFSSNISCQTKQVVFTAANTDLRVSHDLNRTDLNFWIVNKSLSCDVFKGSTTATAGSIYLQCTQATTVTLILF